MTFPFLNNITLSTRWRKSTAWVTRIRVLLANFLVNTYLKIFFFTLASSAEIGSSINKMSFSL